MKKIIFLFCLLANLTAFAQLHQSMLIHLNDLPAFPSSVAAAGTRCLNVPANNCNADTVTSRFNSIHIALTTQLNNTMPAGNTTMPDTSFVSKVQNMTPEQQQAWAMQYALQQQQAAMSQSTKLSSADELLFTKKYAESVSTQTLFLDSLTSGWQLLIDEFNAHVKALDEKRELQIKKCPIIDAGGGEGGPAPYCVKEAEKTYQEAMQSYFTEWRIKAEQFVASKKTAVQNRYSGLEALLVRTNYMANPSQASYKMDAIAVQQIILTCESMLAGMTGDAWLHGCEMQKMINQSKLRA